MNGENQTFGDSSAVHPLTMLQKFADLFASKGWLNQTLRIRHRDRKYRICCSENEFLAYRINDHNRIAQGFAGWTVCLVTPEQIIEDGDLSAFGSTEPSVREWMRCMDENDFELI